MKTVKIINKILAGIIIVAVFFLTVGVAYSYYLARLNDIETGTTVTGNTGNLKMEYDGGPEIIANNIAPSTSPFITKTFTVKGTNTTNLQMFYQIKIVLDENTFSEDAITYTLTGTNTAANGNTIPTITTRTPINQESSSLGIGNYDGKTTEAVHTYELNIYFYLTEDDQLPDLGKTFKAHLLLENYIPPKLGDAILAQGGGASAIEEKDGPDFSKISTSEDTGLYSAEDEYGTSYYYRGEKTELNNNLIWGGFQWKIVRINGDGSIRLLYNGTCLNNSCSINLTGTSTQIEGTHAWNETYRNDAKYVGYMYGGDNGVASTSRHGSISTAATFNQTNTNIKTILDNWYKINIFDKGLGSQVADNLFCNDRQLRSDPGVGGEATGTGIGTSTTYYAAYYRLYTKKTPTLKCGLQNDQFTTSVDGEVGNGALAYPVGLLTADEASMAGLLEGTDNKTNYLYTKQIWWLFTPNYLNSIEHAYEWLINNFGYLGNYRVSNVIGARPSVSLISATRVTGTGSATDPFKAI